MRRYLIQAVVDLPEGIPQKAIDILAQLQLFMPTSSGFEALCSAKGCCENPATYDEDGAWCRQHTIARGVLRVGAGPEA